MGVVEGICKSLKFPKVIMIHACSVYERDRKSQQNGAVIWHHLFPPRALLYYSVSAVVFFPFSNIEKVGSEKNEQTENGEVNIKGRDE